MALNLCILGSTGSVGKQTLDVIADYPEEFNVTALTAYQNDALLFDQCLAFSPRFVVCVDETKAAALRERLCNAGSKVEVLSGTKSLVDVAADVSSDTVVAAIVGAAGLPATYAAAKAGKRILLANKESLVMAGDIFMQAVRDSGAIVLPVDSEHNALFQCMPAGYIPGSGKPDGVAHISLTASGGPFRQRDLITFSSITPDDAVAHPTWSMGAKISVDSATMMNKGLEVIEAYWLFGLSVDQIKVVIHPQSIVHSFLHYQDGSVLAQLGPPDMRVPISHCLAWPNRVSLNTKQLDFAEVGQLQFEAPDYKRFPCLKLAYQALKSGPAACIALNTVNEMAVDAFLKGKINYLDINKLVLESLSNLDESNPKHIDDVLALERKIRALF